jgi:hypothetical protein
MATEVVVSVEACSRDRASGCRDISAATDEREHDAENMGRGYDR